MVSSGDEWSEWSVPLEEELVVLVLASATAWCERGGDAVDDAAGPESDAVLCSSAGGDAVEAEDNRLRAGADDGSAADAARWKPTKLAVPGMVVLLLPLSPSGWV